MAKLSEICTKIYSFLNPNRLLVLVFYAFIVVLSFQTKITYLTDTSYVNGNFVFYNTLFFMISDAVLAILLIFWLSIAIIQNKLSSQREICVFYIILSIFALLTVFSAFVSRETLWLQTTFGLIKLFLSIILFGFILNKINVKQVFHNIFLLNLAISILQVLLGLYQYFYQTSLGLKFLGEEYLKPYLPGVAKFKLLFGYHWIADKFFGITHDSLIMRPYGTFSHPNVFGAYLFFSCLLSYYLFIVSRETKKRFLISIVIFFQIMGVFLSFSRVAICAWIIATFVWFAGLFIMKLKVKEPAVLEYWAGIKTLMKITVSSLVISLVLFYPQYLERTGVVSYGTSNQEAISDRLLFQNISLQMIKQHPLTGVGYLNFVNQMENYSKTKLQDYQLQPVHNVYLLIAAESGLPALILFLLFVGLIVYKAIRNKAFNSLSLALLSVFVGFLFINFFDHYLFTIQQGRLMFFVVAGLLVASIYLNNGGKKEIAVADNG